MKRITDLINYLHPREQVPMRNGVAAHNKAVRGQAGSAALRYEDWQTSRLYGTSWLLRDPERGLIYSLALRQRVSESLDWISTQKGAILVRTDVRWDAAIPCETGARFGPTPGTPFAPPCPLDSET